MTSPTVQPEWSRLQRIGFRIAFIYLVLYTFPFVTYVIPLPDWASFLTKPMQWYDQFWKLVIPWVGRNVFRITDEFAVPMPGPAPDMIASYLYVFYYLVLAVVLAGLWSRFDRGRTHYRRLHDCLRIFVRFFVAVQMFHYGSSKIIQSQFPEPGLSRLLQPFGDASPMGLLWTFMGASYGYNFFTGAGEMIGGLLLTTRRTTLLGALVTFGVMSHVTALNFCYDVPVKIFSVHLVAMTLFLIAPDFSRLANVFLWNRPAPAGDAGPLCHRRWLNITVVVLRTILVGAFIWFAFSQAADARSQYLPETRSPWYGIWNVQEYSVDGQDQPFAATEPGRWRRVVFEFSDRFSVQLINDSFVRFFLNANYDQQALEITPRFEPNKKYNLKFQRPETDLLLIEGTIDGHAIRTKLRRTDHPPFMLQSRGFHWVNETAFNR